MDLEITRPAAWFLAVLIIEAAYIDWRDHRVPNWLTYHLAAGGIAVACWMWGWQGLAWSLAGVAVGMAPLLAMYSIGWMGAGDVKLFGAAGAWLGPMAIFYSFILGALIGGGIGLVMMARSRRLMERLVLSYAYLREAIALKDPVAIGRIAAQRKPRMELIPYGVPLTLGALVYLAIVFLNRSGMA